MSAFFRRFSFSSPSKEASDEVQLTDPSRRRSSSAASNSGRILGARDYKLATAPDEHSQRRASILDDYNAGSDSETEAPKEQPRKRSVPYGPRHQALARKEMK